MILNKVQSPYTNGVVYFAIHMYAIGAQKNFEHQHAMLKIYVNFSSECFVPIFYIVSNKLVVSRITDLAIASY